MNSRRKVMGCKVAADSTHLLEVHDTFTLLVVFFQSSQSIEGYSYGK